MRVGLILDRFERRRGGAERYLEGLLQGLLERGHEARVYCREGRSAVEGLVLCEVPGRGATRGARERAFAQEAAARARQDGCLVLGVRHVLDVDVYQPHGGTWAATAAARLDALAGGNRRRLRRLARTLSSKHRYFRAADEAVFARHPGLLTLAVSPLVQSDILARYGRHRPRVKVIWPAVSLTVNGDERALRSRRLRQSLGLPSGIPVLLFVAHDFALKGLRELLHGLATGPPWKPEPVVLVVGRGRPKPYRRLARRLGVDQQLRFLGERTEVGELYAAADALVHPTWYDPCALACLEALVAGLPVLTTTRNGASPWVMRAGGEVLASPDDAEGMRAALERLLQGRGPDADLRATLREELSWSRHVDRVESSLREVEGEKELAR